MISEPALLRSFVGWRFIFFRTVRAGLICAFLGVLLNLVVHREGMPGTEIRGVGSCVHGFMPQLPKTSRFDLQNLSPMRNEIEVVEEGTIWRSRRFSFEKNHAILRSTHDPGLRVIRRMSPRVFPESRRPSVKMDAPDCVIHSMTYDYSPMITWWQNDVSDQ
ncbi:hypothetical protein Pla52n_12470 [Stieleria varia]|uniref:Uncharacterized protein n=1 Tax=Stieleria varia TaxID=2528005 RepID=A0A5C6AZY9_9BACT|nr:hypothetical protein Pla52n_12470 [Stieleria varia]